MRENEMKTLNVTQILVLIMLAGCGQVDSALNKATTEISQTNADANALNQALDANSTDANGTVSSDQNSTTNSTAMSSTTSGTETEISQTAVSHVFQGPCADFNGLITTDQDSALMIQIKTKIQDRNQDGLVDDLSQLLVQESYQVGEHGNAKNAVYEEIEQNSLALTVSMECQSEITSITGYQISDIAAQIINKSEAVTSVDTVITTDVHTVQYVHTTTVGN